MFKLFISLECKYNKMQFGLRICSTDVSKQKLHISTSPMSKTYSKELLFSESTPPVSIDDCAAVPSRRASRNCSRGLEETLFDRVVNESAIVEFSRFSHDHLTGSEVFLTIV